MKTQYILSFLFIFFALISSAQYCQLLPSYDGRVDVSVSEDLMANEIATLDAIADKHSTRASALASALLQDFNQLEYAEVLVDPEFAPKSIKRNRAEKFDARDLSLDVYPNPSKDWLIVNSPLLLKADRIDCVSQSGSLVLSQVLNGKIRATLVDVSNLAPATYELILIDNGGKVIATETVIVTR